MMPGEIRKKTQYILSAHGVSLGNWNLCTCSYVPALSRYVSLADFKYNCCFAESRGAQDLDVMVLAELRVLPMWLGPTQLS